MSLKNIWNNGFDFENFDRRWFIIIFIPIILIVMRKCVTEMSPYKINKDLYKIEVAREYNGIVIKKGRDRYNHNFSFFNLNDSTEISNEDLIWDKISIGDTVIKIKNSRKIEIRKKDRIILIDYYNMYKFRDSLYRIGQ